MRIPRLRPVAALAAVAATAVVLGGCGGGGDDRGDDASFEGETVTSSDGVLTVQVPAGAAPEGVEVSITVLEEGDLPSEFQEADADEVVIVGYELGPDGAEFAEPVVVTFRVDPGEIGLDLPEGAVPVGVLLTENAAGELESVEGELRREDGDVVAQTTVTHFSPAIVVLSGRMALVLNPQRKELEVGAIFRSDVRVRDLSTGEAGSFADIPEMASGDFFGEHEWEAMAPFSIRTVGTPDLEATISCNARTDGWMSDAYGVLVAARRTGAELVAALFGFVNLSGQSSTAVLGVRLVGEGKCNAAEETPTPSGSSNDGGGSSVELNGANAAGQASGSVSGAAGGCKDGNSKEADCMLHIDFTGMSWGPVEGSPNLLEVGVTLGGAPPADSSADYVVTVVGPERGPEAPMVQKRVRAPRGELSCEAFRGDLEGEACEVLAPDQFVITVDISELTHPLEIELLSMQNTTDGRVGDHYVVEDIGE
jgi:hypothetical protein